jgi:hypothetical protein
MKHHWIRLLLSNEPPPRIDERRTPTVTDGILLTILQNAEPIKLLIYLLLILLPILLFGRLHYDEPHPTDRCLDA